MKEKIILEIDNAISIFSVGYLDQNHVPTTLDLDTFNIPKNHKLQVVVKRNYRRKKAEN